MWVEVVNNNYELPEMVSNEEYNNIKNNKHLYSKALVGFVGFGCSYSGKWWGGYARGNNNDEKPRNYCDESRRNILEQVSNLKGVIFKNQSYLDLEIPENSIIYCDPPYKNTTGYKTEFDHDVFWEWVRGKSKTNQVFVSEYNAPDDFECLWSKKVNNTLAKDTGSKQGTEKLFRKV